MGDRLAQLLEYLGISHEKFSQKLGVSRQTISNVVKGRNQLSSASLAKVLQEFPQVSYQWLLTGEGEMLKKPDLNPDNPFSAAIMEKWEAAHQVNEPGADYSLPEEKRLTTGPDDGPVYGRKVVDEYGPAYQAALERIELLERLLAEKERMIQLLEKLVQK